jgi:hypothetical protein
VKNSTQKTQAHAKAQSRQENKQALLCGFRGFA